MATKNNPGEFDCYAAAHPDEPLFVLRSTDPLAPQLVREWAVLYTRDRGGIDALDERQERKVTEALQCAREMEDWKRENPEW